MIATKVNEQKFKKKLRPPHFLEAKCYNTEGKFW